MTDEDKVKLVLKGASATADLARITKEFEAARTVMFDSSAMRTIEESERKGDVTLFHPAHMLLH